MLMLLVMVLQEGLQDPSAMLWTDIRLSPVPQRGCNFT
jgi:hypothetical protein